MIFLTQLAADNFTRANESPLASPPWTKTTLVAGLQVVSDLCESSAVSEGFEVYTGTVPGNDQYASATIATMVANGSDLFVGIRSTGTTHAPPAGYALYLQKGGGSQTAFLYQTTAGTFANLLGSASVTVSNGDVWTLAMIGSTLYLLQNGTQRLSTSDATYASGQTFLGMQPNSALSDVQISNFALGNASLTGTFSISGNAGVAAATVSYSGAQSGSVTADGSGNYTIPALISGAYTITPSKAGYTFVPTSRNETISSSNITGVNFVATKVTTEKVISTVVKTEGFKSAKFGCGRTFGTRR